MSKVIKVAVAAAAGFVAGILFAPKSGKEIREDLKHKAEVKQA
jgi:gas vesicle protein